MRALFASLILTALLASCGQPARYAAWTTFRDPDGRFTIEYLAPPWELIDGDASPVVFRVPSNAAAIGGFDSAVAPKYELSVAVASGDPSALAIAEQSAALGRGEEVIVAPAEIVTQSGDMGVELATRETTGELRFRRWAFVTGEAGTTVRLALASVPDSTEREVDAMFASLDVDPEAP